MRTSRRSLAVLLMCLAPVALGLPVSASGPAAIYAMVDKVVMEPSEKAPERIQVWGWFAVWDNQSKYSDPSRGYMYFRLPEPGVTQWRAGGPQPSTPIALAEWSDLKSVAGGSKGVAFGERGQWRGRLRKPDEKVESPDPYPIYNGIHQLSMMDEDGPSILATLRLAAGRK